MRVSEKDLTNIAILFHISCIANDLCKYSAKSVLGRFM